MGVFVVTGSLSSALSGCFPSELCKAKKKATNAVPLTVPGLLLKLTVQADVLGSQWESLSLKLAKGKKESCPSGSHHLILRASFSAYPLIGYSMAHIILHTRAFSLP